MMLKRAFAIFSCIVLLGAGTHAADPYAQMKDIMRNQIPSAKPLARVSLAHQLLTLATLGHKSSKFLDPAAAAKVPVVVSADRADVKEKALNIAALAFGSCILAKAGKTAQAASFFNAQLSRKDLGVMTHDHILMQSHIFFQCRTLSSVHYTDFRSGVFESQAALEYFVNDIGAVRLRTGNKQEYYTRLDDLVTAVDHCLDQGPIRLSVRKIDPGTLVIDRDLVVQAALKLPAMEPHGKDQIDPYLNYLDELIEPLVYRHVKPLKAWLNRILSHTKTSGLRFHEFRDVEFTDPSPAIMLRRPVYQRLAYVFNFIASMRPDANAKIDHSKPGTRSIYDKIIALIPAYTGDCSDAAVMCLNRVMLMISCHQSPDQETEIQNILVLFKRWVLQRQIVKVIFKNQRYAAGEAIYTELHYDVALDSLLNLGNLVEGPQNLAEVPYTFSRSPLGQRAPFDLGDDLMLALDTVREAITANELLDFLTFDSPEWRAFCDKHFFKERNQVEDRSAIKDLETNFATFYRQKAVAVFGKYQYLV